MLGTDKWISFELLVSYFNSFANGSHLAFYWNKGFKDKKGDPHIGNTLDFKISQLTHLLYLKT